MTDRQKQLQRLYDIAWNTGATSEEILERKKCPDIVVDAVLHGLERTPDNVAMIYKFIASATELSASTRQELCWGILAPFLQKVWSREAVDEFKKKYPLKDKYEYDPNFIDIRDVENRVKHSGFLNEDHGSHLVAKDCSWGFDYAVKVLQVALGEIAVTDEALQKLHMAICRFWCDVLDGYNKTTLGDPSLLSKSLRLLRICAIKYANTKQIGGLAYPAEFTTFHQLLL